MALRLVLTAFLALAALGEQPPPNPLIGTVEKVSGHTFYVRVDRQSLALMADDDTVIWKSGTFRDLALLTKGDQVRVAWRSAPKSSEMVALNIATQANISGVIEALNPNSIEVRNTATNETRMAYLAPDTTFAVSRSRLAKGQEVLVAGWDVGSGWIEARRVAIYNTDIPVLDVPRVR